MIYKPELEPLSDEDFAAQRHLIATLDLQLIKAMAYLEEMRQAYNRRDA